MIQQHLRSGLGTRIIAVVLVFVAVITVFYLAYWQPRMERWLHDKLQENMHPQLTITAEALGPLLHQGELSETKALLDELLRLNKDWNNIELRDAQGTVLYPIPKKPEAWDTQGGYELFEQPIKFEGLSEHTLKVQADFGPAQRELQRSLNLLSLLLLAAVLTLAMSLVWMLNKGVRQPVQALSEASQSLAHGNFDVVLPPRIGGEVGDLIGGFDRMRQDLARQHHELEAARDEAETANQAKSKFLATVSHELRTPLSIILGFAKRLLAEGQATGEAKDAGSVIYRNGAHLLELVNQILDLAKLESGEFLTEEQPTSLAILLDEAAKATEAKLENKPVTCRVERDPTIPEKVLIDAVRLKQILLNFASNAARFTDEGEIVFRLSRDESAPKPLLRFDVIDTGCGLKESEMESLFEPFVQGASRQSGGAGLGLAISKEIAQCLQGDVRATNNRRGATFTLILPCQAVDLDTPSGPDNQQSAQELVANVRGARLLLAEDYDDAAALLQLELRELGFLVERAADGRKAVALANQKSFHLCLMDMQMPQLDGYGATRELRNMGFAGPIIALTAHAMQGDRAKCIDAGCDEYESKPVDMRRLAAKIDKTMRARGIQVKPTEAPQPSPNALPPETLEEITQQFFANLPQWQTTLEKAFEAGDLKTASKMAHKLAGLAGSMLSPNASQAAAQFERASKPTVEAQEAAAKAKETDEAEIKEAAAAEVKEADAAKVTEAFKKLRDAIHEALASHASGTPD